MKQTEGNTARDRDMTPIGEQALRTAAAMDSTAALRQFGTGLQGLSEEEVEESREKYGVNRLTRGGKDSVGKRVFKAFINPFAVILLALAAVSVFTDIILPPPGKRNALTVVIISVMVLLSGLLRLIQETKSGNAAARLSELIRTTAAVKRAGEDRQEIPLEEVAVGDIVYLSAGDMIPADIRVISAKDLFVSQASLTGESEPVEKYDCVISSGDPLTELPNLAFLGSNVVSGSAEAFVLAVGDRTLLGGLAVQMSGPPEKTSFERGVNAVSWILIRFMLVMVPVVLFVNGFTKGDWMEAVLFAISVAVGLTPEMLPMIVTTCLAKGAVAMAGERVVIKNLNAIQSLGGMDILCTDKTGTLTQDKVALEYHLNLMGREDSRVLRHAFLNSFYQTGLKNLMDVAIIDRVRQEEKDDPQLAGMERNYRKVDEIPFDFERRKMSVVVETADGKTQMITKGAVEEMLQVSAYVEFDGRVEPLTEQLRKDILKRAESLNEDGLRVIAVAHKTNPSSGKTFCAEDERDMVLLGYLAFLDPPKESAGPAVQALERMGVEVKILTGDNEKVTRVICRQVGLSIDRILLGSEIDELSDTQLRAEAKRITVFAKLSPAQKARVVRVLKSGGAPDERVHSVGYLGDGINDTAAMKASDVGISVDTAVDIARESADVILLSKDLMVLERGIEEGRRTYANMIKYIKITASSNFGNMLSVLAACAFLPFLPMASLQLILLNLIYDVTCMAMPWDRVDAEELRKPRNWNAASVSSFMLCFGPVSSVFDILTYWVLYSIVCPLLCGGLRFPQIADPMLREYFTALFQTGWFVESMWSQTLVLHTLRSPKLPFIGSRASASVTLLTLCGIAALTALPYTAAGAAIGLAPLPAGYFVWLTALILFYLTVVTGVKTGFVKKHGTLL